MRCSMKFLRGMLVLAVLSVGVASCRKPVGQLPEDNEKLSGAFMEGYRGFYVLNNGGKGSNKATLDYYDAAKGEYRRNVYAQQNPQNPSMGDDATDLAYYNGRLYVALHGSHKVVMLDANAKYLAEMRVNECDRLLFHDGKGYVTSLRKENLPLDQPPYGEVICFDPATLDVLGRCVVGCQPMGMTVGGKESEEKMLYVSNSGSYRKEGYDNTVSVVDPNSLQVVETFTVGLNPKQLLIDKDGQYLTTLTLGDYRETPSRLVRVKLPEGKPDAQGGKDNKRLEKLTPLAVEKAGDNMYCLTVEKVKANGWVGTPKLWSFHAVFVGEPKEVLAAHALGEIQNAAGFQVHPEGKAFYIFDARNFTSSGTVYCFSSSKRQLEWKVRAGIQPVRLVFVKE